MQELEGLFGLLSDPKCTKERVKLVLRQHSLYSVERVRVKSVLRQHALYSEGVGGGGKLVVRQHALYTGWGWG